MASQKSIKWTELTKEELAKIVAVDEALKQYKLQQLAKLGTAEDCSHGRPFSNDN